MSNGDISAGELNGAAFPLPSGAGVCVAVTPDETLARGVGRAVIALERRFGMLAGAYRQFAAALAGPIVGGAIGAVIHNAAF